MADRVTHQQRHANMAAIHGKDTKPEMVVSRYLWGHGYRYRLNYPRLPDKPNIVMRKYRTCIVEVQRRHASMGWHSITIWECELKPKVREKTLESLTFTLNRTFLQDHCFKKYEIPKNL